MKYKKLSIFLTCISILSMSEKDAFASGDGGTKSGTGSNSDVGSDGDGDGGNKSPSDSDKKADPTKDGGQLTLQSDISTGAAFQSNATTTKTTTSSSGAAGAQESQITAASGPPTLSFDQIVSGAVVICAAAENASVTQDPNAALLAQNCQGAQNSVHNLTAQNPELAANYGKEPPVIAPGTKDPLKTRAAKQIFASLAKNQGSTREQKIYEILHSHGSGSNTTSISSGNADRGLASQGQSANSSGSSRMGNEKNQANGNGSTNSEGSTEGEISLQGSGKKGNGREHQDGFNLKARLQTLIDNRDARSTQNLTGKYQFQSNSAKAIDTGARSRNIRDVKLNAKDESFFAQASETIRDAQGAQGARHYAELQTDNNLFDVIHRKYKEKFEMLDPEDVLGNRKR